MISILDSTLREGEQTAGVYFPAHAKMAVADALERAKVEFIEAGHPIVSEEISGAVRILSRKGYKAVIGAHARVFQRDIDVALECRPGLIGVFFCVSDERLREVFKKTLAQAIDQIVEGVAHIKGAAPNTLVRFTPEDTVRSPVSNVVSACVAAVNAGADIISIADTTGHMVPGTERNMYDAVSRIRDGIESKTRKPRYAVHCHNDRGLALANVLDAIRAGVSIVDATVLGLGERAGITDLAQLMVALDVDLGERREGLTELPGLYELVSKYSGVPIPKNAPVIGENAFTHCAGVHTHATTLNPYHYQSLSPEHVGRRMTIALDHMSGVASVRYALDAIESTVSDEEMAIVLAQIRRAGHMGRSVDLEELKHIVTWTRGVSAHAKGYGRRETDVPELVG